MIGSQDVGRDGTIPKEDRYIPRMRLSGQYVHRVFALRELAIRMCRIYDDADRATVARRGVEPLVGANGSAVFASRNAPAWYQPGMPSALPSTRSYTTPK